jgi:hypothetical protein
VFLEDALKDREVAPPCCLSSCLRITELAEVRVADPDLTEGKRKLIL